MLMRSPAWTGGTILQVGRGMYDLSRFAKDAALGQYKPLTDRAAYVLSLVMTTAITNAILTALCTGEPPEDWKDLIAFRTGNLDDHGDPERFMLPTYLKDIYGYSEKGIAKELANKTHPLLSDIIDIARNRDYKGTEVYSEDSSIITQLAQISGYAIKTFIPFAVQGTITQQERNGSLFAQGLPFIGVVPANKDINQSSAEKLMHEYGAERLPQGTRTKEEEDKSNIRRKIYVDLRKGDKQSAKSKFEEARKAGILNNKEYINILRSSRLDPLVKSFKPLTIDQAIKVFDVATDEEKIELKPLLMKKFASARKGGKIFSEDITRKINEIRTNKI
jgi:hypothetical protein